MTFSGVSGEDDILKGSRDTACARRSPWRRPSLAASARLLRLLTSITLNYADSLDAVRPEDWSDRVRVRVRHEFAVDPTERTEASPQRPPRLPDVKDPHRLDRADPVEARTVRDVRVPADSFEREPRRPRELERATKRCRHAAPERLTRRVNHRAASPSTDSFSR